MFNFLRFSWGLKNLQEQNRLSMWTVSQPANQTFIKGLYSHRFSCFFLRFYVTHILSHSLCLSGEWGLTTISRLKGFRSNHFGEERKTEKERKTFRLHLLVLYEFCSSDRFYSGTVSNNYFLAREKTKRNLPNLELSDECFERQSSSALHPCNMEEIISVVCDDSCVGKVLSETNLLVN